MLTKRVVPCFDIDRGRVVKGTKFVNLRDIGNPMALAERYERERAYELVLLDITAASDARAASSFRDAGWRHALGRGYAGGAACGRR